MDTGSVPFLDTVNGEIAFFRAITHARPVGINRHFHLLAVQQHIKSDTGQLVPVAQLWSKLESLYSLEALENMELSESEESPPTLSADLPAIADDAGAASEAQRVITHPHFRTEFALPSQQFDTLIAQRRLRDGPSSADESGGKPSKQIMRSKSRNAGLVSGDSDSSELTEGEGDEDVSRRDDSEAPSAATRKGKKSIKIRKGVIVAKARTPAAGDAKRRKKR